MTGKQLHEMAFKEVFDARMTDTDGRILSKEEKTALWAEAVVKNCENDNPFGISKWVCGKTIDSNGKPWRCVACQRFIDRFELTEGY